MVGRGGDISGGMIRVRLLMFKPSEIVIVTGKIKGCSKARSTIVQDIKHVSGSSLRLRLGTTNKDL
jgi:hypothetical protein